MTFFNNSDTCALNVNEKTQICKKKKNVFLMTLSCGLNYGTLHDNILQSVFSKNQLTIPIINLSKQVNV